MFNYILYRIGQFIALCLPLKIAYSLAVFISDFRYLFAKVDRYIARENLKVIFPEKTNREILRIRIRLFRNFAKYLVDFFRFSKLDIDYVRRNVTLENTDYIDEALSEGRGVITLTAHLGNWELGGVVVALLGYPFWIVALVHKHKKINNFFNFQRENKGVRVIPLGKALRQSLEVLKENKVLGLAGDRDFSEKGIALDFFGRPTLFPYGPAALSLKTGATIIPCFMLRNKDDTFTLRFEKPIKLATYQDAGGEFISTDKKNEDLIRLTEQYKTILENYIRKYPEQWYMFRRFWKED